ncbi:hypothetical protein TURU_063796 [Turdus rufiventris]|nr:hypothetical protein TURU_063796 [Turdus rufiventris]
MRRLPLPCLLLLPLLLPAEPVPDWKGSGWGGSGSGPSDDCGVGEGTALHTDTIVAQPHSGKQPELWNGCVMAAPQWCDGHMIFLWCLLLKDKHLAYF